MAGDQPRALAASVQAAAAAEAVYAFADAQLQLERALALWDRVPDAAERTVADRVGLLARCAEAAYAAADPTRAAQLVRQAIALVDQAGQPQRAGLLHEQLPRCLRKLGDPAALDAHQQAVRLVPSVPSTERARVLGSLALLLVLVDRFAEARGPAEEAVAIARKLGARAEEANARSALGSALIHLGEPDTGLAELQAAHRLATQAGEVIVVLRATVNRSDGLLAAGRLEEAATVALDGIDEARRLGLIRINFGPLLAGNATWALLALGRWDQAEQVSRQALETAPSDAISVHLLLARAALELGLGDLDVARARLQAVRRLLAGSIPEAQHAGPLFAGLAELAVWRGDPDQARQLVAQALPLVAANPRYAAPVCALGVRVEADRAEPARARRPGQPPTTAPPPPCSNALTRPPTVRPPPVCRSWPPGTPSPAPSGPGSRAPPTRLPGRRRPRPGNGWASPTGSPTPATATPRRCWPPQVTATPPRWCCVTPRRSPAAWAPACSTARSRPWRGAPASTWPRPPRYLPPDRRSWSPRIRFAARASRTAPWSGCWLPVVPYSYGCTTRLPWRQAWGCPSWQDHDRQQPQQRPPGRPGGLLASLGAAGRLPARGRPGRAGHRQPR
jgi:tetratricopeptide (TPR) repeat protein